MPWSSLRTRIDTVLDPTVKEHTESKLPLALSKDMLRIPFTMLQVASLEQEFTVIVWEDENVNDGEIPAVAEKTKTLSLSEVPVRFA